jgi:hypothetical protein
LLFWQNSQRNLFSVTQRSSDWLWSQRNERSIESDSQMRTNGPLRGGYTQYEGDRRVLHPEMKMAGRAVAIVGDNFLCHFMKATMGEGLVVDGALRHLDGISPMLMPRYYRPVHPRCITGVTLSAVDVPVRIGNVTMMSGDMYGSPRDPALRQYSQKRLVEIKASRKK